MEADREQYPDPADVAGNFDKFIFGVISRLNEREAQRLNDLSDFFVDALELADNTAECNAALAATERADLNMDGRVVMMPASAPKDMTDGRYRKFAAGFRIYKNIEPAGSVPITRDELHALKKLPKINSRTEYEALLYIGRFPGIDDISTHAVKPAFIRMLVLFPGLTKDLVAKMSGSPDKDMEQVLIPELFVAYQLMSRLVDESDIDVARESEPAPDADYLLR
ncbi:MAG TPA: hypothetical protein VFW77_04975 [Candidatus Saccharimonadales bacterium]|nr:hypothetical protein [Candidatus Saccharimonadales bacterium]